MDIKSPLFDSKGLSGLALQMKIMADLTKMHEKFNAGVEKLSEVAAQIHELSKHADTHLARIDTLPPGEPGPQGLPGDNTPVKGVHYFTESDKQELVSRILPVLPQPKDGTTPKKGVHYFTPDDIKKIADIVQAGIIVPKVDHEAIAEKAAKKVKETITTKDVKGFEDAHAVLRSYVTKGSLHGGGDTVAAGSGVSITTNTDGKKVISATSSFSVMFTTGTVDGSNKTFVFTTAPSVIVTDNGNAMNKVSADGTVNWTGTTTVVLTQAPNFNVFGY